MRKIVPIILILGVMFISVVFAQENSISSNTKMAFVKEQVKGVFANSNEIQRCYNGYGKFGCSGIGVCVADVYGEKGTKQLWTSSCGGYAYTTLDGINDRIEFKCHAEPPVIVKEQVKCVFANSNKISNEIQKCYTNDDKFGCSGIGVCVADVHGEKGTKQLWTSSCGGYAYTTLDGTSESVEFRCIENSKKIPIVKSRLSVYSKILQQKVKVLHN